MRRVNSAEFAREYKTLTDPVLVMVGKRPVGVWTPDHARWPGYDPKVTGKPSEHQVRARTWNALPEPPYNPPETTAPMRLPQWLSWLPFNYSKDPNER